LINDYAVSRITVSWNYSLVYNSRGRFILLLLFLNLWYNLFMGVVKWRIIEHIQ
jgi:hypothetical protein